MQGRKKRVLFIGSFKKVGKDGNVGGQMFACTSLVNSSLRNEVDWLLIDTTATTNLKRSPVNRFANSLLRLFRAFYQLVFSRVDVVMAFCSSGQSFLEKGLVLKIAKSMGKQTILAPRSGYLIDDITNNRNFKKRVVSILNYCDTIICQGTFWFSFFCNELNQPENKLKIISNWIDLTQYNSVKPALSKPLQLLFLGWVDENKGVWDLFNAVKNLESRDFTLYIAGNGKEFKKLSDAINEHYLQDKIKLLNWVYGKEKIDLLNTVDIFVLPSYKEGLPNSLLEAMASNCAIITTNVGAIPDIIKHDDNGKLLLPGDHAGLTEAILMYLDNHGLIQIHAERAVQTVTKNNSLEVTVTKFKEILNLNNN